MDYREAFINYQYMREEAAVYVSLQDLLQKYGLTASEAVQQATAYQKHVQNLLQQYRIGTKTQAAVYMDLVQRLEEMPGNADLQFLYAAIITDRGLLLERERYLRTGEQDIRNFLFQKKEVAAFLAFLKEQKETKSQFQKLQAVLKKPQKNSYVSVEEQETVYRLSLQHSFLHNGTKNKCYLENIGELLQQLNSHPLLQVVKPYAVSATLSRKHTMMLEREHYTPNIKNVFQYQEYNIYKDNGKNFDTYQSYIELYLHLRQYYRVSPEVNIALCDYCFANTSALSEWYYLHCVPNEEIPMTLYRKTKSIKSNLFLRLYPYQISQDFEIGEFKKQYPMIELLLEKTLCDNLDILGEFSYALCKGTDTKSYINAMIVQSGSESFCTNRKMLQKAVESFLYQEAEIWMEEHVLRASCFL